MSNLAERMQRLHVAERALERYHAEVASGDQMADDLVRDVIAGCVDNCRRELERVARQGAAAWELRHAGRAFSQTAGRA